MNFFARLFSNHKTRKIERKADQQYLDAIEIIKETAHIYLDLLAQANQNGNKEDADRLIKKLNTEFSQVSSGWDGEVRLFLTINATSLVGENKLRLKL